MADNSEEKNLETMPTKIDPEVDPGESPQMANGNSNTDITLTVNNNSPNSPSPGGGATGATSSSSSADDALLQPDISPPVIQSRSAGMAIWV